MSCSGVNDIATTTNWALWSRQFTYHAKTFSVTWSQRTVTLIREKKSELTRQVRRQDNCNCTHAQRQGTYHKQREGSHGHFGPHPLWRALVSPMSAACVSKPRGVGTPARLAHTADCRRLDSLWCSVPAPPPPTHSSQKSGVGHTAVENEKAHSLMSAHLVFRAKMWAFTKLILSCNSATAMGLVATSAGFRVTRHSDDFEKATFHTLLHPEVLHVQVPNSSDSRPVDHPHRCRAVYRHHQR